MDITDTRLHPSDEDDLRWLLCQAAAEMGEKSAMASFIARLEEGRTHTDGVSDESGAMLARKVGAASRVRRIERRLRRLDRADRATLLAAYGPAPSPGQGEPYGTIPTAAIPLPLLLLTARREGIPVADLRKTWAHPPRPAPAPDLPDDATPAARKDAAKAHARTVRAAAVSWEAQRRAYLAPLVLAATEALDRACIAYTATRTRQPDGSVPADHEAP